MVEEGVAWLQQVLGFNPIYAPLNSKYQNVGTDFLKKNKTPSSQWRSEGHLKRAANVAVIVAIHGLNDCTLFFSDGVYEMYCEMKIE